MIKKYRLMAVLLPFLLLAGVSCNRDTAKSDADTGTLDGDTPSTDDVINLDQDTISTTDDQSDGDIIIADGDMLPDDLSACDGPPTTDYLENTHTGNEECPELSKAKFPYFDTDGKIHFCRKCDKVRADDPQCARNLWKEANCKLCHEMPEYDCCGYPCEMPELTPKVYGEPNWYPMDQCDVYLNANNPYGWTTGIETFKHFNVSEGKVGLKMENVKIDTSEYINDQKIFEYDLLSKKYKVVSPTRLDVVSMHKGYYLTEFAHPANGKLCYISSIDPNGNIAIVYDKLVVGIVLTPVIGDKWAFMVLEENDGDLYKMLYAEIGKWQWTQLGESIAYHPNIVGDKLAFYMDDFNGYVCDLSKTPKGLSDCIKVNRTGEQVRDTVLDEENNSLLYLAPVTPTDKLVKVDISSRSLKYEDISITDNLPDTIGLAIDQVKGDFVLYADVYQYHIQDSDRDGKKCYYRISEKKSYCMLPLQFDMGDGLFMINRQSFAEFEGHFLVWMDTYGPQMVVRNMECYCDKHHELCPFDDYTPKPRNKR